MAFNKKNRSAPANLQQDRPSSTSSTSSSSFRIPGIVTQSESLSGRAERDPNSDSKRNPSSGAQRPLSARSRRTTANQNQSINRKDSKDSTNRVGTTTTTATQTHSRPTTGRNKSAQSRPNTGMSTLNGAEGSYVCAIIEHRGIGHEVGIAVMEKETGQCTLTQFGDTPTYVKTIHHLSLHPPVTILVPAGSVSSVDLLNFYDAGGGARSSAASSNSVLVSCLEDTFDLKVTPLKRIHWNDSEGAAYLDRLLVDDIEDRRIQSDSASRSEINAEASSRNAILTAVGSKFYALSAVCALFKHLEASNSRVFIARSLKIKYVSPDGTIMIDSDSARNLELIQNKLNRKSKMSLFGLLNNCITPMGERLLRMNILQPLTDQSTIENRLDTVEECIQSEDRFFALKEALKPLGKNRIDLDKLISSLVKADPEKAASSVDPKRTEKKITEILSLRTLLISLGPIHRALEGASSSLLNVIQSLLSSPELDEMQEEIDNSLNEDLTTGKAPLGNRNTKIFAVKANRSPLLDVARETYSENMGDILNLLEDYKSYHKLPITLKWQANGFHLEIKTETVSRRDLPHSFINVNKAQNGKIFTFTTLELKKYNQRLESSLNEVFLLSDSVVEEIRAHVLARISELYKSSEALSLLDMLVSFSQLVGAQGYTRPEFVHGTLAIQSGRHPILDSVNSSEMVPNNVWSEEGNTFFLITGPNMSGKTTYLCQIALLTVMSCIGSFVPADYASFVIPDCILTRLSNEDSLEQNLSTFSSEMKNTSFILSLVSPRSLVIIDELGRATSAHEGFGIAMAVAEELIRSRAFVFFATHFLSLHESLTAAYRISSQQFQVSVDRSGGDRSGFNMAFHHRLISGCSPNTHYGLEIAKLVDLPKDLLLHASEIASSLSELVQRAEKSTQTSAIVQRRKIVMKTVTHLEQVLKASTLEEKDLRSLLRGIQQDVVDAMEATYLLEDETGKEMEEEEVEMMEA